MAHRRAPVLSLRGTQVCVRIQQPSCLLSPLLRTQEQSTARPHHSDSRSSSLLAHTALETVSTGVPMPNHSDESSRASFLLAHAALHRVQAHAVLQVLSPDRSSRTHSADYPPPLSSPLLAASLLGPVPLRVGSRPQWLHGDSPIGASNRLLRSRVLSPPASPDAPMVCHDLLIGKEQSRAAASYDRSALMELNGERRACSSVSTNTTRTTIDQLLT